jgi:hypothetical protein
MVKPHLARLQILNAVSIRALPQPSLSHQPQDKNGKHHRKKREAKVERKLIKSSLLRLPNEIISMVFRMLAGESADEGATAAGVCFALTSKRIAQLAMQTRIILPKRLLLDEETFIRTHCQGHRQRSAPGMVLNTGPNALCSCTFGSCTCRSSWIPLSQVRREDCITVTTFHHKLMVALREWMPKGILYCAYCGRWTTLCKAHEETSLTVNTTDLPQFISTDHKPYVSYLSREGTKRTA